MKVCSDLLVRVPAGLLALLALGVFCGSLAAEVEQQPQAAADSVLRDYYSGNGLLNRGLHELAAEEYARFLDEHHEHPKAATARYGLAVCLYRLGRHQEAISELIRLRDVPSFDYAAEVLLMLGQCHLALDQHGPAAEAFEQVVGQFNNHDLADDAVVCWAESLYLLGRYDEAIRQCGRLASEWPESPLGERADYFRALALVGKQDHAAAAERLAALLDKFPEGQFVEHARLLLAQCHRRTGALEQAASQYRRLLKSASTRYLPEVMLGLAETLQQQGHPAMAGKTLDQLLERFPDSPLIPSAQLLCGRAWFDQGAYDRALKFFQQAAEADGELGDQAAYWSAKCALRSGKPAQAASELAEAIERFPESPLLAEMHYDRAVALCRADQQEAARSVLVDFRRGYPDHALAAEALQLLALTEHRLGRYDQSQTHCREFSAQYSGHELSPAVAFLSAENEFLAARYEAAAEEYRGFLQHHPGTPNASRARYRLGIALYRLQRFDEAESFLRDVADEAGSEEGFRLSLLSLGDIHFRRGEWKQAERWLRDYVSIGAEVPSGDEALLKLGLALQRQGRHGEACRTYERLLAEFAPSPYGLQASFELGQALVALEEYSAAEKVLQQVLAEDPDSRFAPYARNHLASLATRRGAFDQAAQQLDKVLEDSPDAELVAGALYQKGQAMMAARNYEAAEQTYGQFLEQCPGHEYAGQARAQLAMAQARQNKYGEALRTVEQVEGQADATLDRRLRGSLLYEKAWSLRETGQPQEAAEAYRALLAEDSADELKAHALLDLAAIEAEAARHESAGKLLRRLRRFTQEQEIDLPRQLAERSLYRLAVCEFELDSFEQAAELFEQFIAEFQESELMASASSLCGEALLKTGCHDRAVKHLTRVVEDYPSDTVYGPTLLRLGDGLAVLQRWAASERIFTEYLDRFPEAEHWFQARFGVGWARENQGRYDEAMAAYREVAERHRGPTAARAQFQIGQCLFAKHDYKEAVRELLKVDLLYAYPEWSAAALFEAGRCFLARNMPVEARAHFKQVAEKHGGTRWAELAAQQLAELPATTLPGH